MAHPGVAHPPIARSKVYATAKVVARICRAELIVVDGHRHAPGRPGGCRGPATATVDRLLHHAHVIVTERSAHRLAEALAGKGVKPLA